jgi:hypothetical protein
LQHHVAQTPGFRLLQASEGLLGPGLAGQRIHAQPDQAFVDLIFPFHEGDFQFFAAQQAAYRFRFGAGRFVAVPSLSELSLLLLDLSQQEVRLVAQMRRFQVPQQKHRRVAVGARLAAVRRAQRDARQQQPA